MVKVYTKNSINKVKASNTKAEYYSDLTKEYLEQAKEYCENSKTNSDNTDENFRKINTILEEIPTKKDEILEEISTTSQNRISEIESELDNYKEESLEEVNDLVSEAKNWANKTDDRVDGEEYSAKHYALEAKTILNNCANVDLSNLSTRGQGILDAKASISLDNLDDKGEEKVNCASWGKITGDLTSQTDLQSALDNKSDTSLSNLTADGKALCANMAMPSDTYVNLTFPSSAGAMYTAPADGYIYANGYGADNAGVTALQITVNDGVYGAYEYRTGNQTVKIFLPVKKDGTFYLSHSGITRSTILRFFYARGAAPETSEA